jgi:glycosyltransferase involved in cell wall biosynthesis
MSDELDLSLVLACFNEESHFEESIRQIFKVLDHSIFNYEVIFVDDCSRDRTRLLIDEAIRKYPDKRISKVLHAENTGRGGAVSDGFAIARGEIVGYIDIDLEVHARYIPTLVLEVMSGADVATAERIYRFYWRGTIRWVLSHGYSVLRRWLLDLPLVDTETGFKFFRRSKVAPILENIQDRRWFWDTEVMALCYLAGLRIVEIPCLFQRRFDKRSSVNSISDSLDYLQSILRFRRRAAELRKLKER